MPCIVTFITKQKVEEEMMTAKNCVVAAVEPMEIAGSTERTLPRVKGPCYRNG